MLAHGSIEGIGELWNGVLHPLRTTSHVLLLLALGIFAGQRRRFRRAVLSFLVASIFGLLAGLAPFIGEPHAWCVPALAALCGLLIAIRKPFPKAAEFILFACSGFLLGWDSNPGESAGWPLFQGLFGAWMGITIFLINLANYSAMTPGKDWIKIAFRVAGSWICAASLLFLALSLRR